MPVQNLELTFASKEDSLSVRSFDIRESLSGVFTVDVIARSEIPDIDLESIVGHGATFRVLGDDARVRAWTGVCAHMEEVQAEDTALSTYAIRIVPTFWRATLRENMRIFELKTLPDIVKEVLLEWEIEPEMRLSAEYVKHEYRVQYMETDFAFISRLLEEAGITYFFEFQEQKTKMVLTDTPGNGPSRAGGPLPFVEGHTTEGRRDFVTKVKVTTHVRSGHFAIRDFDFRLKPDYKLFQEHKDGIDRELKLERYQYLPGSFWVESQGASLPIADDKGIYKSDENHGKTRARLALEAERTGRRVVRMQSNAIDLAPGKTFMVEQHPRKDLAKKLLVASMHLRGKHDGDYEFDVEALFADDPVRPAKKTPRPRIMGVQSALVVGPPGEEIHTDEFGRVRAQFHWDREHTYTDESSCWIRVSQGWAGLGYGMITIPRVGQEVLVE
ncbi:MAG: type VI secretion system tip protein VgrG, partial [Myxococcales bacterium]|nr:type VI secretion system tip protein VgrG [Myxococcales bacterium]